MVPVRFVTEALGYQVELAPGESFAAPEAAMVYADGGLGQMSRRFHRAIRTRLLPLIENLGLEYEGPFSTMKEAFDVAVRKAEAKREEFNQVQCVLLSPGAASFELFRNEFDRGNQFKALVKTYVAKKSGQRRFPLSD